MKRTFIILSSSALWLFFLSACAAHTISTASPPLVLEPAIHQNTPTPAATCSILSTDPTAAPNANSYFPPVSEADFSFGPKDAPVTLVEYCDFQSAGCRNISFVIATLLKNRADVRFVFRPFPLIGVLDKSDKAHLAALAADKQGKFWTMYNLLYINYDEWTSLKPGQFNSWAKKKATEAGLDGDQLQAAINAPQTTTQMISMYDVAKKLGIPAVPLLLINGAIQPSYLLDYQNVNDAIGLIVLGQKQFSHCPPFNIDATKQYIATIQTEKGDIVVELLPDKAPLAVNSFVFLARQGWYDGVTFHRVIAGFAAQTGDPSGTGMGNPGYFFKNETSDLKFDKAGMVGMANSGPDTNGSQFFITLAPAPHLDGRYTLFGRVLRGLDVAELLALRDPSKGQNLPPGDKILTVKIEVK
jgi:cyclophilin family peptidyl-prolyl cis-trans isomerase/protein-disulfide isomerase